MQFFLYSRKNTLQEATKKDAQYIGSFRIIEVSGDNVYEIEIHLGKMYGVHSNHFWLYSTDENFTLTQELKIILMM